MTALAQTPIGILRGPKAIAAYLGTKPGTVVHLHSTRQLPTFVIPHDGSVLATKAALSDWMQIPGSAELIG